MPRKPSEIPRTKTMPEQGPDEYHNFEQTLRKLVAVPKREIDAAVEREREARNGTGHK